MDPLSLADGLRHDTPFPCLLSHPDAMLERTRPQPLDVLTRKSPRGGGATPPRDLSHGSSSSHGPDAIVGRVRAAAQTALGTTALLFAQRLWLLVPTLTPPVPLLLPHLSPQAANLLFKIIDARGRQRSTALVTNIDFESWSEYLGDPPLATAFLDRVVDGAIILKIKGKSYRAHRASPARATTNPTT